MTRHLPIVRWFTFALAALSLLALSPPAAHAGGQGRLEGTVKGVRRLGDTVVYLVGPKWNRRGEIATLDQKNLTFMPHTLTFVRGTEVVFRNHDHINHDVYSADHEGFNTGGFNFMQERNFTFNHVGAYTIHCSVHPQMRGYIFVAPTPWTTVVDSNGHYEIDGIPPGTWQVKVWNPRAKTPSKKETFLAGKTDKVSFTLKK